jgi:hypothetical protein
VEVQLEEPSQHGFVVDRGFENLDVVHL